MASALSRLFSQYGSRLSHGQRRLFILDVLRSDNPLSCEAWDFIWREGLTTSDYGQQSSTLTEFSKTKAGSQILASTLTFVSADQNHPNALVPGCGRGHDAVTLASMGFETCAVDISAHAIERAKEWLQSVPPSPDCKFLGRLSFVIADFFSCDLPRGPFAIVYDYMFFCALPPVLRDAWGRRMSEVIMSGGYLIVIVYPTKGTGRPGPPYVVNVDMISNILAKSGGSIWRKEREFLSNPVGLERELLVVWKKDDSM